MCKFDIVEKYNFKIIKEMEFCVFKFCYIKFILYFVILFNVLLNILVV